MSRNQLIFGKFLGCWLACGVAVFIFYIFFVVTAVSRGEHWRLADNFQAFWLHWVMLGIIVAMVLRVRWYSPRRRPMPRFPS